MARRYGHSIHVTCVAGQPRHFTWRGVAYTVVEIFATWHLRDRWWVQSDGADLAGAAMGSDRYYYRVRCREGLLCELYHDVAQDAWVLDRVHD